MKTLMLSATALLMLSACGGGSDTEADTPEAIVETETTAPDAMAMEAGDGEEEICAIRDDDDGECLCRVVNENGECEEGGGVIIIPGGEN